MIISMQKRFVLAHFPLCGTQKKLIDDIWAIKDA